MNRNELTELIRNGENSGVEFKRDDIRPEKLAEEMAALLNLEGGHILLGVENDRTVSGLKRDPAKAEEWVMDVARVHLRPAAIPFWETIEWSEGKIIGIISLPGDAPDKPYKAKRGSAWMTQIRVGTTTRDATDEEEVRLYQQSGRLQYDRKPVPGSSFTDLDRRRLVNYFRDFRRQDTPEEEDQEAWLRLLVNTELMAEDRGRSIPSAGGLLLFGTRPNKYMPQAGVTAVAYPGTEKDYDAKERVLIRACRTPSRSTRCGRATVHHGTSSSKKLFGITATLRLRASVFHERSSKACVLTTAPIRTSSRTRIVSLSAFGRKNLRRLRSDPFRKASDPARIRSRAAPSHAIP